jgi:hypothetical protein
MQRGQIIEVWRIDAGRLGVLDAGRPRSWKAGKLGGWEGRRERTEC